MARTLRRAAAALAALTVVRLLLAAILPLTPDEAYYWVWSRTLAPGYVDHPPMVALWIRTGTGLVGETALGVRLLGPIAVALATAMLADAAERLFPNQRSGLIAGALWNATLLVGAGSIAMTPDTPLLFFWCATIWAAVRIASGAGAGWWLLAGAFAGSALASKYTAVFLWFGIGIWVLMAPDRRRWLRSPLPWTGAMLGLAIFLPVLIWNADHGWVSFLKQGHRVGDWRPERALGYLAELVGGQIGLVTPGIWVLCMAGLISAARGKDAAGNRAGRVLVLMLTVPASLVFFQHALGDRVQGNWPAIIYPAAILAAAGLTARRWRRWVAPSVGLGFGLTAVVLLHAVTGGLPLPARTDPAARQLAGWVELASAAEGIRQRENGAYVVAEEYALISELAWDAPATMPVVGIEPRLKPMDLPPADMAGRVGILVRAEHRGDEIDPETWSGAIPLGFIDRPSARGSVERYRVWRVIGRTTGATMPTPGLVVRQ